MKIEDVIRDMRERLVWEDEPTLGQTQMWADALEQHLQDARQFDPPPEVIEAWPEETPWVAKCTRRNTEWWNFFTNTLHFQRAPADLRTLHHRSKFYLEDM